MNERRDMNINPDLIATVLKSGHTSILEHVAFTFAVEKCSLIARTQLFRHRHTSPTEQSKRSVDANFIGYVIPSSIAANIDANDRYIAAMNRAWDSYNKLIELGIPKEDARYVLPVAQDTQFVITINARELFDVVFPDRMCKRSQLETRDVVDKMYQICMGIIPTVFKLTGPKCYFGMCTETEKC